MKYNRSELAKCYAIAWLFVALGCFGPLVRQAVAQGDAGDDDSKWKVIPSARVQLPERFSILRRGKFESADEEKRFADYYNTGFFPRWTQPDYRSRQAPPKDVIADIRRDLGTAAASQEQQVHRKLCELTLAFMGPLAKGAEFHPLSRYNAMVAIGETNVPETVPLLIATIKDAKQLDGVKVAAMLGLIRHANKTVVGITEPDVAKLVTDAMLAILGAPAADAEHADGQVWMRGQAAEVLGQLGSQGKDGAVATALTAMVADANLPVFQRCKAAHALGQINWSGASLAAEPTIKALRGLASDIVTLEKQGNPSRRRVVGNVVYVLDGLKGVASLAKTDAERQSIERLQKTIEPLLDPKVTPELLKENLEKVTAGFERR